MGKTTSELLIDTISSQVTDVFGIPGTHGLSLYEELRKRVSRGEIRYYMPRLEYGGAIMADYYARLKGNVGVFLSVNGPGFTNSLTALVGAYSEGSPLVLISLNKEFKYRHRRQLHDSGYYDLQLEMARQATKASFRIYSPEDVPIIMERAFKIALEDKMGPVYIEVPVDVLEEKGDFENYKIKKVNRTLIYPTKEEVREALNFLSECSKPILLLGYGASRSNILNYIEKLGIPVFTTIRGKGSIPENHPLYAGTIFNLKEIPGDCLIALGTSFNDLETSRWSIKLPDRILHVDPDVNVFNTSINAEVTIKASAEAFLEEIVEKVNLPKWSYKVEEKNSDIVDNTSEITHDYLAKVLDETLSEDRVIISDAGTNQVMAMDIKVYKPNSYFNSLIFNAMGSAIPASIGGKIASPERQIVSIIGDLGFQGCFNELITAAQYKINFLTVLVEDGVQHFLRLNQKMRYGNTFTTDVFQIDYTKVVEGIGVNVIEVKDRKDLKKSVEEAVGLSLKSPTVLRVHVSPNSIPSRLLMKR
ncbi:thiamine pyrophosphate-binding protein [Saccharolobus solfataricus]|uniref:2-oxoacid oxidoreductase (ferredoxin) n=3 Tax=Saccharolobus solfataricus TaxID=2287 RepID=Q97V62_SACS2|nr:thiamine pyrophosphate-binding protein [Saccharolobus solfataricus]AAK42883.1 Acetolactate synthase large subunit homolog (ilvB-4) [Saccharolobus solfataricus P2]AKA72976.1 thiamine pyrophosphate-binding protein [Saccharolobus solfataricus]AKA75675.1 thiamine pyrophosphate-binding protein [Saccharolobus solfataricus]AKA78368.1 thiamine pyrophosphate-binding protein [Saccharolobus solfataricus]AZF67487.1 thiamine pyrophosphate-binding protein [Saccharolobus solfataricus]